VASATKGHNVTCAFLDTAFEAAATGIGIGGYGPTTTTLLIALTTNGYPGYDPANPPNGPGTIGQGWGILQYTPAQWVELRFGGIITNVYVPPQFSGPITYSFSQVEETFVGGQNVLEATPPVAESLNVTIIAPGLLQFGAQAHYTLALQSATLNGTCQLQCELGGNILSGLLNGFLVAITNGYEQLVAPGP